MTREAKYLKTPECSQMLVLAQPIEMCYILLQKLKPWEAGAIAPVARAIFSGARSFGTIRLTLRIEN
ncbi:MAG: hypothetical protein F6J93_27030 [Oscillatoria sp. SIO1A7]|nr:hypothetical protein [Oscillatoria sp. SIO1A7]NER37575.1 hypothetical protein [Oscillatoria sp. SIO1A7]